MNKKVKSHIRRTRKGVSRVADHIKKKYIMKKPTKKQYRNAKIAGALGLAVGAIGAGYYVHRDIKKSSLPAAPVVEPKVLPPSSPAPLPKRGKIISGPLLSSRKEVLNKRLMHAQGYGKDATREMRKLNSQLRSAKKKGGAGAEATRNKINAKKADLALKIRAVSGKNTTARPLYLRGRK